MTETATDPLLAAFEYHQSGDRAQAEQRYRQILAENPQRADAWHLLGGLCLQAGRAAEAVDLIRRAVDLQPTNPEYFNHLGAAYGTLGQNDEAVACLRRAVQLAPQSAGTHYNLGTALLQQGKYEEAVASFSNATAAEPRSAEAHYNLGNALRELERWKPAEESYRSAIEIRPDYLKAVINLGNVLRAQERLADAVVEFRRATQIDRDHSKAHLNLGTTLRDVGQYDEALESIHRALAIEPNLAEAHNNLGTILQAHARYDEALACYERALTLDPQLPEAHFSRATFRLRQGDFQRGFTEYEWRWKCTGFREGRFVEPCWDGAPLDGRAILLYAEQGLGDTLQFVRFAAIVKQRGGTVIVECQEPLMKILARCPAIDRLVAAGSALPRFDVQAPLLSLPSILKPSIETVSPGPYLFADEALTSQWRDRLAIHRGFRVGICWQGNPKNLFDAQRSFALAQLGPVGNLDGVRLVSLQKGDACQQIVDCPFEVIDLGAQLDEATGPFMDTAAVIQNLDLVITSDTAVAHLAGALGAKVWLALSAHCDWRWLLDREDSPWYPTARLFRQQQLGDWTLVFERMAEQLPLATDG